VTFDSTIPCSSGESLNLPIEPGKILFVLGANGTGKSSLMQHLYSHNRTNARWISAHRQTWFKSSAINMSPADRRTLGSNIEGMDIQVNSRWMDNYSEYRATMSIYDIVDAENIRARLIANAVDGKNLELAQEYATKDAPIRVVNELLRLSNILIEIAIVDDQVVASKLGGEHYSIAQLSDGERNALLLAADILTAPTGLLMLIDEPERHLHRSIISPLLTLLISKRPDCAFVISTHDVMLPLDNVHARTLLLRACTYSRQGYQDVDSVRNWDVDLVPPGNELDDDLKKDILGGRRKLLFIEGTERSLDKPLYSLIFPNVSIIAKSSCRDVEHTVSSVRDSSNLHWISAFGIIDNDRRTEEDITRLKHKGVYALSVFSVESIYYHPCLQCMVSKRQSNLTGEDSSIRLERAKIAAFNEVEPHIQRLSKKVSEKAVREQIFRNLPNAETIANEEPINVTIDVASIVQSECARLRSAIHHANLTAIISHYPVRETGALEKIAKELGFQNRVQYEGAIRKLLMDDQQALNFARSLFGSLASDLESEV
jgi:ABC-type cobalamin/Fe3+-siderophores transport system ATPase subunit